ncbi:uncharacterized protein Dana_GF27042 [Drosophila ananassae]|uniref:Uncharacterized protein n=1 Tax=Drosophila ananassae TaxID=7217 RepID=A0A0P8XUX2_DROAN|nr:uncharacterized protein Dana_GF27042 [Drosophila ananassae]
MHPRYSPAPPPQQHQGPQMGGPHPHQGGVSGGGGGGIGNMRGSGNMQQLPPQIPRSQNYSTRSSSSTTISNTNINTTTNSNSTSTTTTLYTCSSASSSLIAQPPPTKIFKTDHHLCAAYGLPTATAAAAVGGHPCVYCVIPVPVVSEI